MYDRRRFLCHGSALAAGLAGAPLAALEEKPPARPAPRVTPEGRKAAGAGLKYLAEQQGQDGSFGTGNFKGNVGVSALGALALMAGGNVPDGEGAFRAQVLLTLSFVRAQENRAGTHPGFLHNPLGTPHGPMYGHGFGVLFLAKLHGHVADREKAAKLKETLGRAVELTVSSQNPEG